jgi:NhaA family Na+:H+ antiporter
VADRKGFHSKRVGKALPPFGDDFVSIEALSGLVLVAGAVAALVWANVATASYEDFWQRHLNIGFGDASIDLSIQHWVNDGLMTVFFFVVGLEIKREIVRGELRDPRTVALPVLAAIGGMALPALVYTALNAGKAGAEGWAIPAATDIAFAVGVLALLGPRVPRNLKLFVLTLAIVDDIGAIIVIAIFYSGGVELWWLLGSAALVTLIIGLQHLRVASPIAYVIPALALWVCMYESGVHPTIAGVILGLLTPARPFGGRQVIETLEHGVHPWSSFLIVPLFALANAGIVIDGDTVSRALESPVTAGIALGLVLGKTLGITLATALGVWLRLGRLPVGVRWPHVAGGAAVAGIGFTVALFVAELSFRGARLENAIIGILAGSLLSGLVGAAIIAGSGRRVPTHEPEEA